MFEAPVDAWYVWLGVAAVSVAVLGVALGLPGASPPDATAAAVAIDSVATSPPGSLATHRVDAEELRIDRRQIGLRNAGGSAHASVAFGPVTPANSDGGLERVLDGHQPSTVFDNVSDFRQVANATRERSVDWRPAPDRLTIRRVTWEEADVLLVG